MSLFQLSVTYVFLITHVILVPCLNLNLKIFPVFILREKKNQSLVQNFKLLYKHNKKKKRLRFY